MDGNPQLLQNIPTLELPRRLWPAQILDLSERHFGWRAFIQAMGLSLGDQQVTSGLPLQGMFFEPPTGRLIIELGDRPDLFVHEIEQPLVIRVADTIPGDEIVMQIEGDDQTTTLVRLTRINELPAGRAQQPRRLWENGRLRSILPRRRSHRRAGSIGLWLMAAGAFAAMMLLGPHRPRRSE